MVDKNDSDKKVSQDQSKDQLKDQTDKATNQMLSENEEQQINGEGAMSMNSDSEVTNKEVARNESSNNCDGDAQEPHYRERVVERVIEREKEDNTLGIISLVTGITGLVMFACCVGVDLVLGIVALVTGIIGHKNNQNYALAGLIMGAIVVGLNVLALLGVVSLGMLDAFL